MLFRRVVMDSRLQAIDVSGKDIGFEGVSGAARGRGLEGQRTGFRFHFADNAESRKETVGKLCQSDWLICGFPTGSTG